MKELTQVKLKGNLVNAVEKEQPILLTSATVAAESNSMSIGCPSAKYTRPSIGCLQQVTTPNAYISHDEKMANKTK